MSTRRPHPQNVLVTGGSGYLGTVVVRRLLDDGHVVRTVDIRDPPPEFAGQAAATGLLELVTADIRDAHRMKEALSGIHAVVHLAAIVGDPACAADPKLAVSVNLDASKKLYELAEAAGTAQRFVFASTCSTYGSLDNSEGVVDERCPVEPISLYGETKSEFEQFLLAQSRSNSCHPTCLRFATAYGLSARTRFDLTVNEFVRDLVNGEVLEIFGKDTWRPYCHTKDLAQAISRVLAAPAEKTAFEIFNVGDSDENYSKQMILDEIRREVASGVIRYVDKGNDRRNYRVSFDKLRDSLGFRIENRVADGIREIRDSLAQETAAPEMPPTS